MEINGEGFLIRQWALEDIPSLARHANNANVSANLRDGFPYPYSEGNAEVFISANLEAPWNYAIDVNGEAVGGIGLVVGLDVHRLVQRWATGWRNPTGAGVLFPKRYMR